MLDAAFRDTGLGRRKKPRAKFDYPARMIFAPGVRSATCAVVDLSATGAKLKVLSTQNIPDEFLLLVGGHSEVKRKCRVVWRANPMLGVRFLRNRGAAPPSRP
jgi:PilZ domain